MAGKMEFICSFVNRCFHSCYSWNPGPGGGRGGGGGGGSWYLWEFFLVGICRPVLQTLTLIQTRQSHFSHSFFRPDLLNPSSFSDMKYYVTIT